VSSVIFMAFHLPAGNMSALAMVNLTLFGVFFCLLFLETQNLWLSGALHAAYNFFEYNVFGIQVSGAQAPAGSVLRLEQAGAGTLLNGGDYGIEGGLPITAILLVTILLLALSVAREGKRTAARP